MLISTQPKKRWLMLGTGGIALVLLTVLGLTILQPSAQPASALSGSSFNAGYIIDDAVFYNENALTVDEIQAFLSSKVTNCDTNGTQPAYDYGRGDLTHAQYASTQGWHGPPYVCLKDYKQNIPSMEAASGLCNAVNGAENASAAQIIYIVAHACHINPQVLIVLLQKEQSLITDTWPLNGQYTKATGFACPDTNPPTCDPAYKGFFYQLYYAGRQYQIYKKYPNDYNYIAGRSNNIYYNPGPKVDGVQQGLSYCGSSQVYIQNQATAALYIYTPYQPNQAALNDLYGSGDICSAHGNRNFWRLFNDWFGSSIAKFTRLDTPRWMVLNTTTKKYNPSMNIPFTSSATFSENTQVFILDKIYVNGQWFYRTEFDSANGNFIAIPANMLSEIQYVPLENPRSMLLNVNAHKFNPLTGKYASNDTFVSSLRVNFVDKIYVNGQWFYRTEFDQANNIPAAFFATSTAEITFQDLENPRYLHTNVGTKTYDVSTGEGIDVSATSSDDIYTTKVLVNNHWYYQKQTDDDADNFHAVSATDTSDITITPIATPYTVKMTANSTKYSLVNGQSQSQSPLTINQVITVTGMASINGTRYYQTEFDRNAGNASGILVSQTTPQSLLFVPLDNPRYLSVSETTRKINLQSGAQVGDNVTTTMQILFTTKTQVNGVWYLRSQFDTSKNLPYGIPITIFGIQ